MFIRTSTILSSVIALAGVTTAVPTALEVRTGSSSCTTGTVQCCSSYQTASSTFVNELFGYLGLPLPPIGTQVGFTCSPITTGGVSTGSSCTSQPTCCTGNSFSGAIVTGCSPTTINA